MQPVPYGALADTWRHRTSFSRLGDLAPGVSTPLVLCNLLIRFVAFFLHSGEKCFFILCET